MLYQLSYTHHACTGSAPAAGEVYRVPQVLAAASGGRSGVPVSAAAELGGERLGASSVSGPGCGHEDRPPVVAQLLDALPDVGQRAVAAVLGGAAK